MATCNDIIRLAMGRLRQLHAGEKPTAQEAMDGLIALQSMFDAWKGAGLFGRMYDVITSGAYTANEQDRVINDGGYAITLPLIIQPSVIPSVGNGYWSEPDRRCWGNMAVSYPRPPRDLAMIEIVQNKVTMRSFYDAPTRSWVRLDSLVLTATAPLASRGATGLSCCLATQMADDYGADIKASTQQAALTFMWGLTSRYDSARVAGMQDYF
jgi:hypothetical protein